jgi:hypothetical protein
MALTTLSNVKSQLGFKDSDTQFDVKLTRFMNAASDTIESLCAREFSSLSRTELAHGNRSNTLIPLQYPITAVSEIRISSERDWGNALTLVPANEYGISNDGLSITFYGQVMPSGFDNVRIIYTAGYSTIPADLEMAVIWASEFYYLNNNRGDMGRTNVSKQGESVSILEDMPRMIRSIIQMYKRVEFPTVQRPVFNS